MELSAYVCVYIYIWVYTLHFLLNGMYNILLCKQFKDVCLRRRKLNLEVVFKLIKLSNVGELQLGILNPPNKQDKYLKSYIYRYIW